MSSDNWDATTNVLVAINYHGNYFNSRNILSSVQVKTVGSVNDLTVSATSSSLNSNGHSVNAWRRVGTSEDPTILLDTSSSECATGNIMYKGNSATDCSTGIMRANYGANVFILSTRRSRLLSGTEAGREPVKLSSLRRRAVLENAMGLDGLGVAGVHRREILRTTVPSPLRPVPPSTRHDFGRHPGADLR